MKILERLRGRGRRQDFATTDDCPVLLVPGVLGTTLEDAARPGLRVWGSARGLLLPRDVALPPEGMDALQPREVLWSFVVFPGIYSVPVYEDLAASLETLGYQRASLEEPTCRRGLYGVAYDWRRDIVIGARALEEAVDRLQTRLGVQRVHLLGHSWGCNVIRYFLRYGGADVLSDAPEKPRPGESLAATFFALGPLYGGTLRALHEANHGFPVGPLGLGVAPHQAAMAPCLYQLLPYDVDRAVDQEGRTVPLDLSDVATWTAYSWGPFNPRGLYPLCRGTLRSAPRLDPAEFWSRLERFLRACLERGKGLWELLQVPHPIDARVRTVTYAVRNTRTLTRLVLARKGDSVRTVATDEGVARRWPRLLPAVTAPGDGYVTFEELRRLAPTEVVVTDPEQVPEGSYLLAVVDCSHRFLYKKEEVLTNLLRNL